MSKILLYIDHLYISGRQEPLNIVEQSELLLESGKIYGILGDNGAGKSTLLRAIAGLNRGDVIHEKGNINIDGINYALGSEKLLKLNRDKIAYFFQQIDSSYDPRKRIKFYFNRYTDLDLKGQEAVLSEFQFESPSRILNAYPHQLSGGEKQRVTMALLREKKAFLGLYDEPFVALDGKNINIFIEILKQNRTRGNISVISSHIEAPLRGLVDEVFELAQGRLKRVDFSTSLGYNTHAHKSDTSDSKPLLVAKNINFSYDPFCKPSLISDLNLTVSERDFILLTGVSGSGKSTLLKLLSGMLRTQEGEVYDTITGKNLYDLYTHKNEVGNAYSLQVEKSYYTEYIQYVSQDPYLALPPFDSFEMILKDLRLWKENQQIISDFCQAIEIPNSLLSKRMTELSGGQRQLLYILICVLFKPKILVLDEAFSALSSDKSTLLLEFLIKFQFHHGTAIIYATHQYENVINIATQRIEL